MISIADAHSKKILAKLQNLVEFKTITAVEAWDCFSAPKELNKFKKSSLNLSASEITSLKALRDQVQQTLKKQINKRCAYCKRAMGQHGMSWHIEHIYGKTKFPKIMFSLSNLTYACIDCNMVKNNSVDRANPFVFDIINPNTSGFIYSDHLNFFQLSTEEIHILKYKHHSPQGANTYEKLMFENLEQLEIMSSLNQSVRELGERIDDRLADLIKSGENREVADFLHHLKLKLASE